MKIREDEDSKAAPMKALSFRQPWAELILQGRKTLDLRTYVTHYRGPLAIHASKTIEREACAQYGLDPDKLATGGVVGVVELVDVIPLTQADYEQRRAEHLAGRSFREGMHGWTLRNPQRLPELVPARGRMSLFNVELESKSVGGAEAKRQVVTHQNPVHQDAAHQDAACQDGGAKGDTPTSVGTREQPSLPFASPPHHSHPPQTSHQEYGRKRYSQRSAEYGQQATDTPFELLVTNLNNDSPATSYVLSLRQRVVQPTEAQQTFYGRSPAYMIPIVTLSGDTLRAVSDHVLDALREAGYKATDLSPARRAPFRLPEAVGVRLGLVFMAVKPLSKLDRIEAISHGIRQMTLEELYYWYSKCTATDTAERAQKALRLLLAAE